MVVSGGVTTRMSGWRSSDATARYRTEVPAVRGKKEKLLEADGRERMDDVSNDKPECLVL